MGRPLAWWVARRSGASAGRASTIWGGRPRRAERFRGTGRIEPASRWRLPVVRAQAARAAGCRPVKGPDSGACWRCAVTGSEARDAGGVRRRVSAGLGVGGSRLVPSGVARRGGASGGSPLARLGWPAPAGERFRGTVRINRSSRPTAGCRSRRAPAGPAEVVHEAAGRAGVVTGRRAMGAAGSKMGAVTASRWSYVSVTPSSPPRRDGEGVEAPLPSDKRPYWDEYGRRPGGGGHEATGILRRPGTPRS